MNKQVKEVSYGVSVRVCVCVSYFVYLFPSLPVLGVSHGESFPFRSLMPYTWKNIESLCDTHTGSNDFRLGQSTLNYNDLQNCHYLAISVSNRRDGKRQEMHISFDRGRFSCRCDSSSLPSAPWPVFDTID